MNRLRIVLAALALILLGSQGALAQEFPELTGQVVDAADLLSPEQEAQLTQLSAEIEQASSRQFVVATIPDLQGYDIADYGYRLGRHWGIGQEGANNGIMLIVAPNDREVRIEVGYGLEPLMTDALSSIIIRDDILPRFRDGDMAGGILAGAAAIGEQMRLPLEAAEARAKERIDAQGARRASDDGNWVGALVLAFWIVVFLVSILPMLFGRRRGRRYRRGVAPVILWGPGWGSGWGSHGGSSWGGGSGGGGFGGGGFGGGFSGGGGSFGGGGASGSW